MAKLGLYDMFDHAMAEELGVPVEEYVKKIESIPLEDCRFIIEGLMEENEERKNQSKIKFKEIK